MNSLLKFNKNKAVGMSLVFALLVTGVVPGGLGSNTAKAAEAVTLAEAGSELELRILHTNDTHAHLDNVARRITAIKQATNDNTLLVDAGDVFSGTLYFNQYNGLADLWFMNYVGYDAMTFGNHEFDKGTAALADFIKGKGDFEGAKFPFVSSNLDFSKDASLKDLYINEVPAINGTTADGKIYPAIIKEVDGEKVGIFGLTTPDTISLSSPGVVEFKDYIDSSNATIEMLEGKGINKIVLLSHLGYTEDEKLAEAVEGIDVIVGGHSHTVLSQPVSVKKEAASAPTLIVQTGEYGVNLGQLDVSFDRNGVITAYNGKLINVDAQKEDKTYVYADDEGAIAKLNELKVPLETLKTTVVGKSDVALDGVRDNIRMKETNLGNLIADGMRDKMKSILNVSGVKGYVTIQNAGGIRASIDEGDITLGELLTVMPFGNNLTALKMTGEEIIAALENGVSGIESNQGRFPQVSGMRFYYDSTKTPEVYDSVNEEYTQQGARIVKVDIKNDDGSYSSIDPAAYYMVATNSFMANGGDFYYSMLAAKNDGRLYELNLVDYEVFKDYLNKIGTVTLGTEDRITDLKGTTPLTDIAGHWAAKAIEEAVKLEIVKGFTDGTFRPEASATRAEFATMVSRTFKLTGAADELTFADLSSIPAWARPFVVQLVQAELISGYSDNTFRPNSKLTRIEMTAIIVRALGLPIDETATLAFDDANEIPAWARPYIAAASKAGIVNGTGNNKFSPNATATRAEVVTLLLNALEYASKS